MRLAAQWGVGNYIALWVKPYSCSRIWDDGLLSEGDVYSFWLCDFAINVYLFWLCDLVIDVYSFWLCDLAIFVRGGHDVWCPGHMVCSQGCPRHVEWELAFQSEVLTGVPSNLYLSFLYNNGRWKTKRIHLVCCPHCASLPNSQCVWIMTSFLHHSWMLICNIWFLFFVTVMLIHRCIRRARMQVSGKNYPIFDCKIWRDKNFCASN